MAELPEALSQMARLLGEAGLRGAPSETVEDIVERRFEALAAGLISEAAASDDVVDRQSAMAYLEDRLAFLGELLTDEQRTRLRVVLREGVADW